MFSRDKADGAEAAAPFTDLRLPDSLRAPIIASARKVRSGSMHTLTAMRCNDRLLWLLVCSVKEAEFYRHSK